MLTLLYFALRINPQFCMLHVLKSEVFIQGEGGGGGGGGGGPRPPLSEFSESPLGFILLHNEIVL